MTSTDPVICVGCAPSAGSTLLADLFDAVPGIVCPPELNIFGIPDAYRWDDSFLDAVRSRSPFPISYSLAADSQFFNVRHLDAVGLDEEKLDGMLANANSLGGFVALFSDHFRHFRRRRKAAFAEKTPLNLHCAAEFVAEFPNGLFVVLVRDGRAVAGSLRRRGYTLYESTLCWLWESRIGEDAVAMSDRVIEVDYEGLVVDPFGRVADIVSRIGIRARKWRVARRYRRNSYRAGLERVDSWRASDYGGKVIPDFQRHDLSEEEVSFLESVMLVRPDGSTVGFEETLIRHGYEPRGGPPAGRETLERHAREYVERSENLDAHAGYALVLRNESVVEQMALIDRLRRARRQSGPNP